MAAITARRQGELVRGVFQILRSEPNGLRAGQVLAKLAAVVPPTDFEKTTYPKYPNLRRYDQIARFSTIGAVKAGWLVKEKGNWSLTKAGLDAFNKFKDPEALFRESGRLYREWRDGQPDDETAAAEDDEKVVESATLEEIEEAAWAQIDERLAAMDPYDLQSLVGGLLVGMGNHIIWNAPPGKDGGVDVIAQADAVGADGPRIKVQVKRRADRVQAEPIRAFLSRLEQGDVGLFVATGGFTSDAEQEARQARQRLTLLDAKRLFELWVKHYGAIPEEQRRLLPWKAIYYPLPSA